MLPSWLDPRLIFLVVLIVTAFALFNFLTDALLKVFSENVEKAIKSWITLSATHKVKGCLNDRKLEIVKLLEDNDGKDFEVRKMFNDEVNTHGNEGEAINCLMVRDHPFKTSAFIRGGGVKSLPNLPTDSIKKLAMVRSKVINVGSDTFGNPIFHEGLQN